MDSAHAVSSSAFGYCYGYCYNILQAALLFEMNFRDDFYN
jgi:hypothetical protein